MKNTEQSEEIVQALRDKGYEPRSYSGRGMYGDECIGVSTEHGYLADIQTFVEVPYKTDSLGKGIVVYWPSLPWSKDFDQD